MAQAQQEPVLNPVPNFDQSAAAGTNRKDADFWTVKDGLPRLDKQFDASKKRKVAGFCLAVIISFAAAVGAYLYLKAHGLPSGPEKSAAVVAPGAALPGPLETSVPSVAARSDVPSLSPPPAKVAVAPATPSAPQNIAQTAGLTAVLIDPAQNFAAIRAVEARLDDLSKQVGALAEDIKTLIAGHTQSKEQLAQLTERVRNAPAAVVAAARPAPPRYPVARVAAPRPAQPATVHAPNNLVSVDLWNGTPSVAISEGDHIRFMSPGDVTAQGLTVKKADPTSQQVTFAMPSGDEVTARVDARN
jgi:hypothetical protein